MIKQQLKKIILKMATWPIIGRLIRIGVRVIRMPWKKVIRKMATWPIIGWFIRLGIGLIRLPRLGGAYLESNHQYHVFETEQLPTLLQTISDLNHRQLAIDNDKENFVKSVPITLRKITRDLNETRQQLDNMSNSVCYLLGRVEFVRRELMFEMRYKATVPTADAEQIKTKVEIINPEKLTIAQREQLRLNLGCGHIALEGYLNIDRRALPGVDIVAEVDDLPFKPGEVDEIFSAHLLEHFPQEQLRRQLFPYYFGLLKAGGIFRAVVPDAEAMIQAYTKGEYPYANLREVMYGAQDYDGDFHFNMFTPESIKALLEEAGFSAVQIHAAGRPNGKCFELEISATKKLTQQKC